MPRLQPAGVFGRLFSSIFPKKLEVQVRSEELPDGRIALTPVYLLAGQEVDPALVSPDPKQRILGHSVIADKSVLSRLPPGHNQAAEAEGGRVPSPISNGNGVLVQGKTGEKPAEVQEVKPQVMLTLNPGDTLDVHSQLVTDQGVVVAKPLDLETTAPGRGMVFCRR